LVAHGLPALVANQYSVLDSSATSFAQHFYWSLAQGRTLGQSAREARIAVNYSLHGELIDWAVPVLYARDADTVLCAPIADPIAVPSTSVRSADRRAVETRSRRVAVWDLDNVFPKLDTTIARMNAVQPTFGFELVDLSAPLDAWDLHGPGNAHLMAERLARRIQSKTVELGVDLLTCVTRHPMEDRTGRRFGWWPADRKPPVAVFSCASFPALEPEGVHTDRAIANTMVSALAGFFGELDPHERGRKDCPLTSNRAPRADQLVSRMKFDAKCRKQLAKTMGKELKDLEALMKAFW
jgi:hypothetical protein